MTSSKTLYVDIQQPDTLSYLAAVRRIKALVSVFQNAGKIMQNAEGCESIGGKRNSLFSLTQSDSITKADLEMLRNMGGAVRVFTPTSHLLD